MKRIIIASNVSIALCVGFYVYYHTIGMVHRHRRSEARIVKGKHKYDNEFEVYYSRVAWEKEMGI